MIPDAIRASWSRPTANWSLFLDAPYKLGVRAAPDAPAPLPHEVVVRMTHVGICGSDVHMWKAEMRRNYPITMGHEGAGIVHAVGSKVTRVKPGDRVALEPVTRPAFVAGMVSRFFVTPQECCHKLDEGVSLAEAAYAEPFAVSYHGAVRGNVGPGSRVLVLGAGPIGLNCILASKALGASWVGVTDINPERLERAKALTGVDAAILTADLEPRAASSLALSKAPAAPDVVLDAAGFEGSIETALRAAKISGTVVLIGMPPPRLSAFLVGALMDRELDFRGSYCYGGLGTDFRAAFEMINTGKVDVRPMITDLVGLEDVDAAFKKSAAGGTCTKVMFEIPQPQNATL
ncbi:chaperonin 10-like protein [Hyaloraphidium curvatum]|nr:chaperonin 10-like protein [Hyaloraphidium curvatum]